MAHSYAVAFYQGKGNFNGGGLLGVGIVQEIPLPNGSTFYQLAIDNLARLNEGGSSSTGGKVKSK